LVVVAVRFKMAYYPVEAVKNSQNRLFWHFNALLYDWILFVLPLKFVFYFPFPGSVSPL
jgi:hypothetical protein